MRIVSRLTTLLIFVVLLPLAASGQGPVRDPVPAATATGTNRGVVTAADTGDVLRGVDVRVVVEGQSPPVPIWGRTDAEGRYEVNNVPRGQYIVSASKTGYLRLSYGQTRPVETPRPVQVSAGQVLGNIDFALPRHAVIVVRLVDQFGAPAPGYQVRAFQPRFNGSARSLAPVAGDTSRVTDDRGEIRVFGLAPGQYYLAASPGIMSALTMGIRRNEPQTFYPGTASETDAQPVTVGLGDEVVAAFQLASSRVARISGVIAATDPSSKPSVSMTRRTLGSSSGHPITVAPDGTFSATNLPPALDDISARGAKESGTLRVQVSGEDIDGLVLTMKPPATLRGRFTFDAKPPAALRTPAQFRAIPETTGISALATVKDDGTFEIAGVMGTGVLRFTTPLTDWFMQSVLLDGEDVTDTPRDFNEFEGKRLEVHLTQRPTQVTGRVVDSRDRPATDYVAVIFSEDASRLTSRSLSIAAARPDQLGRFTMRGLPPGRYLIAAVDYLEPGQERDPGTLERLRRNATALTLAEGESRAIDLKLAP